MLRRLVVVGVSLASLALIAPSAEAQLSRVFVSVTGNDGNVCSNVATPCRTLAGGITQVDPDGEVIVIDSGSYAGGTIAKAVKMNVASGVVAFSGLPFVVNPGAGQRVVLRGLTLKALTVGSGIGIDHQSGTLFVENTVVDGWDAGLQSQSGAQTLLIKGSVFRNNTNFGLHVVAGSTAFAIDQSFFENNYFGIAFDAGTGRVSNTAITASFYGVSASNTEATFQRCEVSRALTRFSSPLRVYGQGPNPRTGGAHERTLPMLRKLTRVGLAIVCLLLLVPGAEAQVSRVFVSVNGNDANVCSNVATPCRTLAGGIAQVDPDGEVIVIESGSYAGGTITKPVKVNVASGVVAFSGLSIVVNPGVGNKVVLRGLTIKAATVGTGVGIDHLSGILYVENTVVDGWDTGLFSNANELTTVKGSIFRNNAFYGVYSSTGPVPPAKLTVDDSFVENNGVTGIFVGTGSARVSNTVITGHDYGAVARYGGTDVTVERCQVWGNSYGLAALNGGLLRVSGSTVTRNQTAGLQNSSSTLISSGNNVIDGNPTNTSGTITTVALQ